jgi:hypothetical protein
LEPINTLSRSNKGGELRVQTRKFRNSQSFLEGGPDEMGFLFMFCKIFPRLISEDGDGIPTMLDGSISMEEPSAFISKFNPFD